MSNLLAMLFFQDSAPAGSSAAAQGFAMVAVVLYVAVLLLMVASLWKVFTKAGEPGWAAIVPIYNLIVLLKIAGKPAWWILLMLIPLVNLIPFVIIPLQVAKNFGKGTGFALGLMFLGPVFYPILGFGSATYHPVAA